MKKYLLLFLLICIFTGCKSNELTKELFIEKASDNAYIIQNTKKGYENYDYILDIYYAVNVSNAYDIQFIELKDEDYAKRFFELNKSELEKLVDVSNTYVKNSNSSDYNVYHIENDTKYMLVIRSKKNILYIDAPISYILEIEEFLSDMDLDY